MDIVASLMLSEEYVPVMRKGLLAVLSVAMIIFLLIGILVGDHVGGPGSDSTSITENSTRIPGATPTPIPPPSDLNSTDGDQLDDEQSSEKLVQKAVATAINRYRQKHNLPVLSTSGHYASKLSQMATVHSKQMMNENVVKHRVAGNSTSNRYAAFGLSNVCSFPSNDGYSTIRTTGSDIELIAKPISASPYENVAGGYDGNPKYVADKTIEIWTKDRLKRQKLKYKYAEQAGIGVSISTNGDVYIVIDLCGA